MLKNNNSNHFVKDKKYTMRLYANKKFKSKIPEKYISLNIDSLDEYLMSEIITELDFIKIPEYIESMYEAGYLTKEKYTHTKKKFIINSITNYMKKEKEIYDIEHKKTIKSFIKKIKNKN